MRFIWRLYLILGIIFSFVGGGICADISPAVNGNTEFAVNLYHRLKSAPGNIAISPCSISTAFAMVYLGARGKTAEEIRKVMHFLMPKRFHSLFSVWRRKLEAVSRPGEIELLLANSLWLQKDFSVLEEFVSGLKKFYEAKLYVVDFARDTEGAMNEINLWVEKKTAGKIKELISRGQLNPQTRLVLCNAVYFKGKWRNRFDVEATRKEMFWVTSDKSFPVDMMHQKAKVRYKDFGEFEVVELPYNGERVCMVIFLPKDINGLNGLMAFEERLSGVRIKKWLDQLARVKKSDVEIALPRFKCGRKFELEDVLKSMGMKDAFSAKADFSGISKGLSISKVIHQAVVEVDEEGTKASAATAIVVTKAAVRLRLFCANHPFFFLIWDKDTGTILFMGRVISPIG